MDPCYVVRHRVFGKPWKALELFRFPRVSMIYNVDFPVDFLRKKIPDVFVNGGARRISGYLFTIVMGLKLM